MKGLIEDTVNAMDLEQLNPGPGPEQGSTEPEITPEKIGFVVGMLKNPAANGGILRIGRVVGWPMRTVKQVQAAIDARRRELADVGEIEPKI